MVGSRLWSTTGSSEKGRQVQRQGSDVQEDHPQDTRWRRQVAPSLGALEAKVQGHDDECNDREEHEHDPGWASH